MLFNLYMYPQLSICLLLWKDSKLFAHPMQNKATFFYIFSYSNHPLGGPRGLSQGVQVAMICVNANVFMIWADI